MALTSYSCCLTPNPLGATPYMYIGRTDSNQVCILDTRTIAPDDFLIYQAHPVTGDNANRASRKKVHRVYVYGSGTLVNAAYPGYMFVTVDGVRTDTYVYTNFSGDASQGILWKQDLQNLIGRSIVVTLLLQGTAIIITELQVEYTPVN
jgi:hypothetical protein